MGRRLASPSAVGLVAVCACVVLLGWLVASTPAAVPFGDVAVIELTTGTALRTPVLLGPYSQYGWHHPGPLQFYLHAPLYLAAGSSSLDLTLAALLVNGLALAAMWRGLAAVPRVAAFAITAAVSVFVWRAGDLVGSAWNAHVIVIPLVTMTVLCAVGSLGSRMAMVGGVVTASLAMQSSVSVVPYAVVVLGVMGILAMRAVKRGGASSSAIRAAIGVGVLLWLPPIIKQLTGAPGNATRIWRFFATADSADRSFSESLFIWSDALTSAWRPEFTLAWGNAYVPRGSWSLVVLAGLLVIGTAGLAIRTRREPGLSRVCALASLGALLAWWSVTRIVGPVGAYQVFWIAAIGALLVGCLAAHAVTIVARGPAAVRYITALLGAVILVALAAASIGTVGRATDYASNQAAHGATRYVVAVDTARHLVASGARRPRFHFSAVTWSQAAGIVLHAHRSGLDVTVDDPWVAVFGTPFASQGGEDVVLEVTTSCGDNDRIVARHDALCVYERAD